MTKGARAVLSRGLIGGLIVVVVALYVWQVSRRTPVFELYIFDTPGAPSFFIRKEDDRRILIHGGSNSDIVRRVTDLLPFYSRRIDTVVALDDDPKHVTGLIEVLGRYDVGAVLLGTSTSTDQTYEVFMQKVREKGIVPTHVASGDYIEATPLRIHDMKRPILTLEAAGQTVLLVPFSPAQITRKLVAAAHPDYLIYSAAPSAKSAKQKSDALAGIMDDHRFNIRAASGGGVRVSIKKAPEGARLSIEPIP